MRKRSETLARRPLAVANWKMYLSAAETVRVAASLVKLVSRHTRHVDVIVCPSFPLLSEVQQVFRRSRITLGAQDIHAEERGPFTGDVSVSQLRHLVRACIVGHSERRQHHGETDAMVAAKARRALHAGLHPIVCVGESATERDAGRTIERVRTQVTTVLEGLPALDIARTVFAYEPLWAISPGPGQPVPQPMPQEVAEVVGLIRKVAADVANRRYADRMRVLYGGSVTAATVVPFVSEPHVDGVLVGGASTQPAEFAGIVREIVRCRR